jgi:hypothetical protein
MLHPIKILCLTVGILVVVLIAVPVDAHPAVPHPSSPDSSAVVFKHVSPEAKSVGSLAITLITVLVGLLALIIGKEGVQQFYDTYPYISWLSRPAWLARVVDTIFWLFSARKCIGYVLGLSIGSTIVCFLGHLRLEEPSILRIVHWIVEGAMFIAIGLFIYILVRVFGFCLSYNRISVPQGDRAEGNA